MTTHIMIPNKPTLPAVLENLQDPVIREAVWWMRLLGISKIMIKETLLGLRSIEDVNFKALAVQPPEELRILRNTMIRNIADRLSAFGVLEVEITPEENEIKELVTSWEKMKIPGTAALTATQGVKMNTEIDPTGDKVIKDDTAKQPEQSVTDSRAVVPAG